MRAAAGEEERSRGPSAEGVKERVGALLSRLEAHAGRKMARGTAIIATIGATAPFIGLSGTVWGIMDSFITALAPYAEEAIPPELSLARLVRQRRRARPSLWQKATGFVESRRANSGVVANGGGRVGAVRLGRRQRMGAPTNKLFRVDRSSAAGTRGGGQLSAL